jgi:F420-dependent oxidoreductase-like protein
MKLGATTGIRDRADGFKEHVQQLEAHGIEYFWSGEAYTADAVSTLGFVAAITERAQIGSSILPIYTRTPALLAMTAVGLDRLSNGRFILGIGSSGPQVIEGFHGVPYDRPLGRTREIIDICRSVWRRDRLEHHGANYDIPLAEGRGTGLGKPLKIIGQPVRDRIPIFVAALGPKNVELTAELADGWQPLYLAPELAHDVWGDALRAGATKRAPDLGPLEIVAGGLLAIGDDVDHLRDAIRPTLALYYGGMGARGANYYNDVLRRYGYEKEADEIQDLYLGGERDAAAARVPRTLVDAMSLVGDVGFVKDRVAAYRDAGVTILNVEPIGPNGLRDVATLAEWLS